MCVYVCMYQYHILMLVIVSTHLNTYKLYKTLKGAHKYFILFRSKTYIGFKV